jgi:alpha-1,3-mannosyltransferase
MGGRHFIQALKLSAKNNFCDSRDPLRYRRLKKELVKNKSYIMIAFNLFNNQEVVPDFIIQLESLIRFIGVQNVFVAAYENGSNDQTKTYMELLHGFLQDASVANSIHYSFKSKDPNLHRIDLLSHVRNQALEPLFQGTVPRHVDKVLFLNDVFFCADDMKELLHQSIIQKADLTCGLDFDTDNDGVGFYDTWVGRDMHGAMFNKRLVYFPLIVIVSFFHRPYKSFSINPETNDRLKDDLPVQV